MFLLAFLLSPGPWPSCWQFVVAWGGSRAGSGGSVEPPKVKQTLIF